LVVVWQNLAALLQRQNREGSLDVPALADFMLSIQSISPIAIAFAGGEILHHLGKLAQTRASFSLCIRINTAG